MKKCFVVSPIGGEGTDIRKRADQVFKYIISPVCETCGFDAVRVDHINQADPFKVVENSKPIKF